MSIVINQLIVRTNEAIRMARAELEIEESGSVVAALQGSIAGAKDFLGDLAAEEELPFGDDESEEDSE